MSLLDKATIITTPTAHSDGTLHSIKGGAVADFDVVRGSAATRVNAEGLIESVATNIPRIDYTTGEGVVLLEPQSTNLITNSEGFSQWSTIGSSVVSNAIASPSGEINAVKIVEDSSLSVHRIDLGTVASATQYTMSVFAKAGERSVLSFGGLGLYGNNEFVQYDLINGTAINTGTTNNATVSIESYGNGWYRCVATYTAAGTSGLVLVMLDQLYAGNPNQATGQTYQGDGASGLYVYGAQVEVLSYPTSYIPTSGAIATRLADSVTGAGDATTFNSTEGVLYAEVAILGDTGVFEVISLSNGSTSDIVGFVYRNTTNDFSASVKSGGSTSLSRTITLADATDFIKVAISYKLNEFKFYINGVLEFTDTSGNTPISLNTLQFTDGNGTSNKFKGKVKALAVFNEALTDSELECLTKI